MTREQAIEILQGAIKKPNTKDGYLGQAIDMAIKALEQEPRKGHWVYTPQRRMVDETDDGCVYQTDYRCSCSECGGDFGFARVEDSFCKYCGADMRGEEE